MVFMMTEVLLFSLNGVLLANAFHLLAPMKMTPAVHQSSSSRLQMSSRFPPGGDYPRYQPDNADRELLSGKFKNLITERAMSSLVYCYMEFHDDLTPRWLTEFTHAAGEISKIGWAEYMGLLMTREPEELVVRRIAQRPRGGSGNNPYLSEQRTQFEYTVLIDPLSIARKVLNLRECISDEWLAELPCIKLENAEINRHHVDLKTMDAAKAENSRRLVMDLDDPFTQQGSPLRAKNHKLLVELITKASIERYKNELRYFGDQYTASWVDRFLRDNEELKGNELLEAMMEGVLLMIQERRRANSSWNVDGQTMAPRFVDPTKVAQAIMKHREAVAEDVAHFLEGTRRDHSILHMRHLEYQFSKTMPQGVSDALATDRKKRVIDAVGPQEDKAGNLRSEDGRVTGDEFSV